MSSIIQVKMEELNALPATKIVENEGVQAKFIQMYNAIWGTDKGEQMYHKEVFNFQKLLRDNPDVATSSKMSLYPKSVIRISLCRTAKRNPLIFPI